ncbi:MAG TPA: DUF2520 domain-containing protein [Acidimicrobiales bacterium]|jgi:predicted short-subunit dehydrogenase-like oxidoreductase (DUF2520 family)|nr:DUF2520 domain-containing protein [Acidimicrobiales bacterium]
MNITIVGAGRAGSSFLAALRGVGHEVRLVHHDALVEVGAPELILLCVPDDAIRAVSDRLAPSDAYVVAHLAGSRGLDELNAHARVGLMHPLAALPTPELGAPRLLGALYSVAGDDLISLVVSSLKGRALRLTDDQRAIYHATATVAANHLVALMGHVQVLAESAGLTLEDFLPLSEQALADVALMGVSRALTGPASRADMATIDAHLAAIPASERSTYVAMANAAFELAEQRRLTSHL